MCAVLGRLQSVLQHIASDRPMPGGKRHSNRHSLILHGCAAPLKNMYSVSERRQYDAIAMYDDASVLDINMSQPLPVSWTGKPFEITAAMLCFLVHSIAIDSFHYAGHAWLPLPWPLLHSMTKTTR